MYVYLIRNTVNGKVYVGQTTNQLHTRFVQHKNLLRKGKHTNQHLQSSWNKYGEKCWQIELLFECSSLEELNTKEIEAIESYNSQDRAFGYNLKDGGDGGGHHAESTKEKLRLLAIQQWEDNRATLTDIRKKQWTSEYKERMSSTMKEKWKDTSYVEKQTVSRKSPAVRDKLKRSAQKNKSNTSETVKARWKNNEYKARVSESIRTSNTEEVRAKRSESIKNAYSSPEVIEKHRTIMKQKMNDPLVRDKLSNSLSKYFGKVQSPSGEVFDVFGIRKFCREHNLGYTSFRNLKLHPNKTYKGWKFLHEDNN